MHYKRFLGLLAMLAFAVNSHATARQWLHVHVQDMTKEEKVRMNIPLSLVETMLPLVEEKGVERGKLHFHHQDLRVEDLRKAWNEIRDAGDMEFLSIENRDTHVRVFIQGKYLMVQPEERSRKNVNIRVPLAVVDALLSGEGEELNLTAAVRALRDSGIRDLITIEDTDKTVRIWIDDSNLGK